MTIVIANKVFVTDAPYSYRDHSPVPSLPNFPDELNCTASFSRLIIMSFLLLYHLTTVIPLLSHSLSPSLRIRCMSISELTQLQVTQPSENVLTAKKEPIYLFALGLLVPDIAGSRHSAMPLGFGFCFRVLFSLALAFTSWRLYVEALGTPGSILCTADIPSEKDLLCFVTEGLF